MALISFRYGIIFIKTRKTAGTSIEVDLARRLEPGAVVTPVAPAVPGHRPRNYIRGGRVLRAHAPASEIRAFLGAARFARLARICVEREPVDKCLSHFHMLRNSPYHNPDGAYRRNWDDYCSAGELPVDTAKYAEKSGGRLQMLADHVIAYERLQTDLPALLARFGVDRFHLRSRAKAGYRHPVLVRRADVTTGQRKRIYAAFEETRKLTGLYV